MPTTQENSITQTHEMLLNWGASDTHKSFSVADTNQFDVVYGSSRILIAEEHGQDIADYYKVLDEASAATLEPLHIANVVKPVFTFGIPRESRTLSQVSVMGNSNAENTTSSELIYEKFGKLLGSIATTTGKVPDVDSLRLNGVLYSRMQDSLIMVPGVKFVDVTEERKNILKLSLFSQLTKNRALGLTALLSAFDKGLGE